MDTNFDELLGLVGDLGEKLRKNRRGNEILNKLTLGDLSPDQAVQELFEVMREEGLLESALSQSQKLIQSMDQHLDNLLPMVQDVTGKEVVNPLWEAALAERISLDGDVPELRHGPLPPDGKPAVPVLLENCTDPVMVGVMLERASQEVQALLKSSQEEHLGLCRKTLALTEKRARETGADVSYSLEVAQKMLPLAPTGVPGYLAGQKPDLYRVTPPSGSEVLALTEDQAQHYSYLTLSTTQGRVSLTAPIETKLIQSLVQRGLKVSRGQVQTPIARANWLVASYGAGDFSPRFNYVGSAIAAIRDNLLKNPLPEQDLILEVLPYNGISTRTFGWEARIGVDHKE
jgi:hypothetical protein